MQQVWPCSRSGHGFGLPRPRGRNRIHSASRKRAAHKAEHGIRAFRGRMREVQPFIFINAVHLAGAQVFQGRAVLYIPMTSTYTVAVHELIARTFSNPCAGRTRPS
jgi:hypothetical protein